MNITDMAFSGTGSAPTNTTGALLDDDSPFNLTANSTDWLGTNISATFSQEQTTLSTSTVSNLTAGPNVTDIVQEATTPMANGTFVFNHTLSPFVPDNQDFFHHLSPKDETLFVSLIVMGIIIPVLFVSIFALVCIRKRKEKRARRAERLLRNAQDLAMDDYPPALYKIQALRA